MKTDAIPHSSFSIQTFFEKFDEFADAPDAVVKMRELFRQLAVQGELVEQKHTDGVATQLLGVIAQERIARASNLRTREAPSQTLGDSHPFEIPGNWAWTKLGNIALQIQYGYTASADPLATDIRLLRITDIQNDRVDWPSVPGCQIEDGEAEKYLLSKNDILIARTGGTIGKSFIVPDAPVKSVFASYLIRVTPPRAIDAHYLKIFLGSPLYWMQLRDMSAGTGQPNVNGQALGRLDIPLPPLAEQKRIVAKVDELMALCDQLEAQQKERETRKSALVRASLSRFAATPTPANLDFLFHNSYDIPPAELRKSILTLAVQGKLVPQDPNDEPAQHAIIRTNMEKNNLIRAGMIAKQSSLPSISDSDLPFEVPSSWVWIRLESICEVITKGSSPNWQGIQYVDNAESGVLFITSENVGNYSLRKMNEPKFVERRFNDIESRSILQRNDLLVNLVGASIGRSAIYDRDVIANINQAVGIVRLVRGQDAIENWYLLHYLNSPTSLKIMFEEQVETARANLSLTNMKHFLVPIPPLAEQRRIVAKVDQLMALVDELERQLETSRTAASKLLEAVVHELTSTDPKSAQTHVN